MVTDCATFPNQLAEMTQCAYLYNNKQESIVLIGNCIIFFAIATTENK